MRGLSMVIVSHNIKNVARSNTCLGCRLVLDAVRDGSRATLRTRSDSLGTLAAVNKLRSKTLGMAAAMRELAMDCPEGAYAPKILGHLLG